MSNTTGQKFGGRKKGTPNKITNELREYYQLLINENLDQLKTDIISLEPKDRIRVFIEISKFILPTLKATELTTGGDLFTPIIINLNE